MKWSEWFRWLLGVAAAAVVVVGVYLAMAYGAGVDPFGSTVFRVAIGIVGGLLAVWAGYGQLRIIDGEQRPWGKWLQAAAASVVLYAALGCITAAFAGRGVFQTEFMRAAAGVLLTAWAFALALGAARMALRTGPGLLGVARTVLDEAIRMKVAMVFMALLLLVLPVLPFVIGGDDPLRYRVQTFLSYSFAATGFLLSLMTIFLACWTLSYEIEEKRIFMLAVKPIGRVAYLMGKWLGIVVLDLVLLVVASAAIYLFTVFYLAQLPAQDAYDATALQEEVLTARVAAKPHPVPSLAERVDIRLRNLAEQNPQAIRDMGQQEAEQRGMAGVSPNVLMEMGAERARVQLTDEVGKQWLSVGPRGSERYVFAGLGPVRERWDRTMAAWRERVEAAEAAGQQPPPRPNPQFIQLRYQVKVSDPVPNNQVQVLMSFNDERRAVNLVVDDFQVMPLPAEFIDQDGRLELIIRNPSPQNPTLTFTPVEGLEVLYQVGGFGANFARGVLAIWVKLSFLAMLGLTAATFLSFPVACMLSLLVFFIASTSPFLLEAVGAFGAQPGSVGVGLVQFVIKSIGYGLATLLSQFARFSPASEIVNGRLFSWERVLACILWIGVVWTVLAGAIGALIFRSRELARVQV